MSAQLTSAVVQIFAKDVRRAIAFYRLLGLAVPEPGAPDPHVDVELPGGNRLSFDAEETITGMHPEWTPPDTAGRVALAFGVGSPAEVPPPTDGHTPTAMPAHRLQSVCRR
jgi:catechol 2,3-dioxygenase-like lactoylglutathione lyase family enzyme